MVFEHRDEYPSQWSAITSIAASFSVSSHAPSQVGPRQEPVAQVVGPSGDRP